MKYTEGASTSCAAVVCCRGTKKSEKGAGRYGTLNARYQKLLNVPSFLSISRFLFHFLKKNAIRCDVPTTTFESALLFVKNFPQKADFILYGGFVSLIHSDSCFCSLILK